MKTLKVVVMVVLTLACIDSAQAAGTEAGARENDGGVVQVQGKGKIVLLDCDGCLGEDMRNALSEKLSNMLLVRVEPIEAQTFRMNTANYALAGTGGEAGVFFVEDPGLPMSLVAQEECWGLINVYWLQEKIDRTTPKGKETFNSRVRKEFARVIVALLGPSYARTASTKPQRVRNWQELDANGTEIIPFEALMAMFNYMPQIGIERIVMMSYREACEAGMAPPPTNETQKCIAEEVRKTKASK